MKEEASANNIENIAKKKKMEKRTQGQQKTEEKWSQVS
jgi:hypothetical protein